jgi:aspartoacylase
VLVVAGTHGNERNAPWLIQQWLERPGLLQHHGLEVELALGNPAAFAAQRRYIDRDLNRTFLLELLADPSQQGVEVQRARQLLERFGPGGPAACPVALDLHSTTAAMGNSLVVYGRRPADLALAAVLQHRLGLPIYLHEGDPSQVGYLVEQWPCGLVIEVGPVAQGLVTAPICRRTQLAVEAALASLAEARAGRLRLPVALVVASPLRQHRSAQGRQRRTDRHAAPQPSGPRLATPNGGFCGGPDGRWQRPAPG